MSLLSHLKCSYCGKIFDHHKLWNLCPKCQKPLFAVYDIANASKMISKEKIKYRSDNMWRYRELLPVSNDRFILSLGEGFTPLIKATRLAVEFKFPNLYIKDEGVNPTGSFKARGLSTAVSRAWELGAKSLSIPSAGNAAGALSAYAALAGLAAYVYMPKDVPSPFIAECTAMGAHVELIDGLITDCAKVAHSDAQEFGRFDISTLKEPYRLEGKKTMGYEIAEQFNWRLPDVIIYPTGGGTGLIGMWKAFDELEELGWVCKKRPRMVTVQPEGCAPMVKAFNEGFEFAEPWQKPVTIAAGLRVPAAVGDFLILKVLRESEGTAITVSDKEMMKGANLLGRKQGLFVSPESGATLIAFQKLLKINWIKDTESVVLFNTGSGYKYSNLWKE